MGITTSVVNSSNILPKVIINVVTIITVISVISAVIAVSIIVSKFSSGTNECCNPFTDEKIVLQSSSSIILNRAIQGYETFYYYKCDRRII